MHTDSNITNYKIQIMKNTLALTLMLGLSIHLCAQKDYSQYYDLMNRGYTEYANKEYQKAIEIFDMAFSNYYPFPDDVNMLKKCYLAIDNKHKAYETMRRMVLCGFKLESSIPLVNSNTALEGYRTDTGSGDSILEQKLAQEYPKLRAEYLKNIDWESDQYLKILTHFEVHTSLMRKKCTTTKQDQMIGDYGFGVEKEMFMNLMASQKNVNRAITDTWTSNEMEVVIIHTSQSTTKEDYELYFNLLKEQVLKGNISNVQYAVCYDNYLYRHEQESYYGQQIEFNPQTGSLKCAPIDDIQHVDQRRAEIGLPPLWVWGKISNIELPEEYKMN